MRHVPWPPWVLALASAASLSFGGTGSIEGRVRDLSAEDPVVRRAAAAALGESGTKIGTTGLVKVLTDADAGVRREAAKALGFIKDPAATVPLVSALSDADLNVRFNAAYALGEIRDPRAIDALLRALKDPDPNVRTQAAWSLREMRGESVARGAIASMGNAATDHRLIGWLLKQCDVEQALAGLKALLDSSDARTRERVIQVFGAIGAGAEQALIASLQDPESSVRRLAITALAQIGGKDAAEALRVHSGREKDEALRKTALQVADRLDPPVQPSAHWPFDDGDVARDATGRGTDGKATGCVPSAGKVGLALDFRGAGCIELGKPAALPTANQPMTVMAWVNSRAPSGVVVARGGAFCGYSLYIKDGVPKFGMRRAKEDSAPLIVAGQAPIAGRWAHLAGVIGKDRLELYVDGKLAASTNSAGPLPGNCGQGMEIGFDVGNSAVEICDHFDGCIDEVKVFQDALDARAIAAQARH